MAEKLKIERIGSALIWSVRTSGRQVFRFDVGTVHATMEDRVRDYGLKKCLSDAAAGAKTETAAIAAMKTRAEQLADGSWGQRRSSLPDADVFQAHVALGMFSDSDEMRQEWVALKPAERRALARDPAIVEWLDANADDSGIDTEALRAKFKLA